VTELLNKSANARWNGRFAPSPTGALHIGNLRTALVAWLVARSNGASFVIRMEDLDPVVSRRAFADSQLTDLAALGLDWDGDVVFQSDRHDAYSAALNRLRADGLVYECFCTRKEIQAASQAPNGPGGTDGPDGAGGADALEGRYPGTCRNLTRAAHSDRARCGRPPALRLRASIDSGEVTDLFAGVHEFPIDDLVLQRNDGTWAYNLAVVVDDAAHRIGTVVRADDLLSSTPRQLYLGSLIDLPKQQYVHVPLVLNDRGQRLAKRDGPVTLPEMVERGHTPQSILGLIAQSLGLNASGEPVAHPTDLLVTFDLGLLPKTAWVIKQTA
jgi:glutamyl-tRNA synthetase